MELAGDPGDLAFVVLSAAPSSAPSSAGLVGPLLLEAPVSFVSFGALPPSGRIIRTLSVPNISASVRSFYMQGFFVSVLPAELALGSPTQVQLLDSSF